MTTRFQTARELPFLTSDLPGVGGIIKRYNEDFVVEEVPLYPASGQGTHIYFTIEKQGLPTLAAINHVARALGRNSRDVGYAGLKDAHGVTRQLLSIEHEEPDRVAGLEFSKVKVLSVTRHTNKIKLGHLAGNRFIIKIRDFGSVTNHPLSARMNPRERDDASASARAVVEVLSRRGVPNYFGPQRFGVRGDNAEIGLAALRGDFDTAFALMLGRPTEVDHGPPLHARKLYDAGDLQAAADAWPKGPFSQQARLCRALIKAKGNTKRAWHAVDHTLRRFYISAFQSELFNRVLARRIAEIDRVEVGDIAWKHANGACFRVEDAAAEQPRADRFEISPTGPLFGRRMTEASGEPGELESAVLAGTELAKEQLFAPESGRLEGARRPLRVPLQGAEVESAMDERGPYLLVTFFLPAGAYATNVLREICKTEQPEAEGES
jgi:tRNA pseudouridine13 synthase